MSDSVYQQTFDGLIEIEYYRRYHDSNHEI